MEIKFQTIGKFSQHTFICNNPDLNSEEYAASEETVDPDTVAAVLPFQELWVEGALTPTSLVVLVPFTPVKNNAITLVVKGAFFKVYNEIFGE